MTRLHVEPTRGPAFDYEVEKDRVIIGRSSQADLVIADGHVSREHTEIVRDGSRLLIRDLGSRNGTQVNGVRITETRELVPGDQIQISTNSIRVAGEDERGMAPPEARSFEGTVFLPASELLERFVAPSGPEAGADDFRRQTERLAILNEVHRALATSIERKELLELILDRAFDHLGPQQGAVFLGDGKGGWRRVAGRRTGRDDEYLVSETLVREVAEKGLAALVLDTETDQRFREAASILSSGVRSLIAAPLLYPEGSLGMIALSSTLSARQFDQEDLELLSSLASVAALRIWSLSLAEEAAERRRMAAELEMARRIQTSLLPERLPAVEGYELEALNVPSRGVSGDFYQVLPRSGGAECVLFLADVSGKGMAAALLTATLEALAAVPIDEGSPAHEICTLLSRLLERRTPAEKFATAFLAVLDLAGGGVTYANAGHNPALVIRTDGGIERLKRTGIPLGLLPEASYESGRIALAPGDLLVAYTDGITEAASPEEEEYGLERLEGVCRRHRSAPLPDLVRAMEAELVDFIAGGSFADDRTLILLRREAT